MPYLRADNLYQITKEGKRMKPYGLPRKDAIQHPDMADIREYGRPSHVGRFPGKSGVYRANLSSDNLKRTRRIFKKIERARAKNEIRKEAQ
jgi:hypothetical protein